MRFWHGEIERSPSRVPYNPSIHPMVALLSPSQALLALPSFSLPVPAPDSPSPPRLGSSQSGAKKNLSLRASIQKDEAELSSPHSSACRNLYLLDVSPLCYSGKKPSPSALLFWLKSLFRITETQPIIAVSRPPYISIYVHYIHIHTHIHKDQL